MLFFSVLPYIQMDAEAHIWGMGHMNGGDGWRAASTYFSITFSAMHGGAHHRYHVLQDLCQVLAKGLGVHPCHLF